MQNKVSNRPPKLNMSLSPPSFYACSGSSSRAYKIAGITLLACVLIAGQVMTAYFLLSQRSDIQSLEEKNNNMNAELTKGRSGESAKFQHR